MKTAIHPDTGEELVLTKAGTGCDHCVFWPERVTNGIAKKCRFHEAFVENASHPFRCLDSVWMTKTGYVVWKLTR